MDGDASSPQSASGLDGAGHHAVGRVWKLGRHGRYLAARRVGARSSLRESDLRGTADTAGTLGTAGPAGTRENIRNMWMLR